MIGRFICSAIALAGLASPALANDARLVTLPYRADVVERLDGRAGVQATIAFGEDEHIENVAIGDSTLWQVTPNKRVNMLFLKPLHPRARTNLTVVTDQHSYFFDLVAGPDEQPVYFLRFHYPDLPKPPAPPAALTSEEAAIAKGAPEAVPVDPSQLDFAWRAKGKPALTPVRIYDDGRDTYLSWPAKTVLPAILVNDEKGNEGPVNFSMRGDVIVVEGVPRRILLRAGRDVAILEHTGPDHPRDAPPPAAPSATTRTPAETPVAANAPLRSDAP
jgi:type IV secretion system protein VirB9